MRISEKSPGRMVLIVGPASLAVLIWAGQVKATPALAWFPIDLTAFATVIVFAMMIAARVRFGPATGRVAIPIYLWVAFLPAIAFIQFDSYSTSKLIILFTTTLILAVAPFYLLRDPLQRKVFLVALAAIAVVFAITGLITPSYSAEYTNRLIVEGANTIGTGRVAMTGTVIMIIFAFQPGMSGRRRLMLAVMAVLTSTLGVMTGSVGPVVAVAAALVVVVLAAPFMRKSRGRAVSVLLILGAGAVWVASENESDGLRRIMNTLAGVSTNSGNARLRMWEQSVEIIKTNPFGIGWGMYQPPGLEHGYPHNIVLEVGVEGGWLPMLLFGGLLIVTLVRGIQIAGTPDASALLGLYVFALLNAMVSESVNGTRLLWVALFALWVIPLPGREDHKFYSRPRARSFSSSHEKITATRAST